MIANDSFRYIALYVNCSLCYVTKMKGEWLPRTKNTLTTMPQEIRNHKSPKMKRLCSGHHLRSSLAARSVESLIKFNVFSMRLKLNHDTNNIHDRHALHTSFNSFDFVFVHFLTATSIFMK